MVSNISLPHQGLRSVSSWEHAPISLSSIQVQSHGDSNLAQHLSPLFHYSLVCIGVQSPLVGS